MYNETLKKEYLSTLKTTKDYNLSMIMFEYSESFEVENNKDLSKFNRSEIITFLNDKLTANAQTAKRDVGVITKYHKWANGGADLWKLSAKKDLDFVSVIKNTVYPSWDEIFSDLSLVAEFSDGYFVFPAACFAWLGLTIKEASLLTNDDVNLINGTICCKGKFVTIPEAILISLREYKNTNVAYRSQGVLYEVYAEASNFFLRRMLPKNSKKKAGCISPKMIFVESTRIKEKLQEKTGLDRFSYSNIYKSGQLYRTRKLEESGIDVLSSGYRKQFHAIFDNTGDYYDYVFLYKKYKEAFNLD